MATHQMMSATGVLQSDTAATVNALVERDVNGDIAARDAILSRAVRASGGAFYGVTNKTTSFTADATARYYTCNTSGGSITCTLPAAASSTGQVFTVIKTNAANSLIVDGNAAELVSDAITKTATANLASLTFFCDGTQWWVIASIGSWV